MARGWTDEQKARQAALIRSWKPWTRSTGPRTPEGKAVSSKNVLRGTAALAIAMQELQAARAKVARLSRSRRNSTDARTPEGKARSSRNAFKGGFRAEMRAMAEMLREFAEQRKLI